MFASPGGVEGPVNTGENSAKEGERQEASADTADIGGPSPTSDPEYPNSLSRDGAADPVGVLVDAALRTTQAPPVEALRALIREVAREAARAAVEDVLGVVAPPLWAPGSRHGARS
jgi:hypothetical protein